MSKVTAPHHFGQGITPKSPNLTSDHITAIKGLIKRAIDKNADAVATSGKAALVDIFTSELSDVEGKITARSILEPSPPTWEDAAGVFSKFTNDDNVAKLKAFETLAELHDNFSLGENRSRVNSVWATFGSDDDKLTIGSLSIIARSIAEMIRAEQSCHQGKEAAIRTS